MPNTALGDRMKQYESAGETRLPGRMPVIVRIDGCHFHTYTAGMKRPYDEDMMAAMAATTAYLCANIMGARLGYIQSDEISLLLINYERLESQSWFDNRRDKMVSVAAAMTTAAFGEHARSYLHAGRGLPYFDARAFVLPESEVANYFVWRQKDATRNSIAGYAQSMFSHKQLHGKDADTMQEMMWQKGFNWNEAPVSTKRGFCVVKEPYDHEGTTRTRWVPDWEIPVFTQDRAYVERFLPGMAERQREVCAASLAEMRRVSEEMGLYEQPKED